jgi:DNA polymerase-4
LTLKVKYSDFKVMTRSRTAPVPLADRSEMRDATRSLLKPIFPVEKGIRLLGVSLSSFGSETQRRNERQFRMAL